MDLVHIGRWDRSRLAELRYVRRCGRPKQVTASNAQNWRRGLMGMCTHQTARIKVSLCHRDLPRVRAGGSPGRGSAYLDSLRLLALLGLLRFHRLAKAVTFTVHFENMTAVR